MSKQWRQYWDNVPGGYTIAENLIDWVSQNNHMIDSHNSTVTTVEIFGDRLDEFIDRFDPKLQAEVIKTLSEWQDSGLLDVIIDEALQTQMDVLEQETQDSLNSFDQRLAQTVEQSLRFKGHTNSDSAVTELLNIGLSYTERPLIWYGQEGTAVSTNNTGRLWDGTHYLMDCSSFVEIVLRGVTYENSAYLNQGVNYPTQDSIFFDEEFPRKYDRMLANEQAKYCVEKGWSYYPNDDWTNVQAGDLVFMTGATNPDFFRNIGHVGFVLNNDQNENITVLEMGNADGNSDGISGAGVRRYGKGSLKSRGAFFGRIPLKESQTKINNLQINRTDVRAFRSNNELKSRKVYSVLFDSPISNGYFNFGTSTQNTYYNFFSHMKKMPSGKYRATFVIPPVAGDGSVSRFIRFYALGSPVGGDIEKLQLYDGVVTNYDFLTPTEQVTTNDDGTLIQYDNGIMECFVKKISGGTTTPQGDVYVSDSFVWTYPATFVDEPIVTGSTTIMGRAFGLPSTPSRTSATINTISGNTNATESNVFIRAIGRWKD